MCNIELFLILNIFSYFNEVPAEPDIDILDWWQRHEAIYPNLSRMACDYLSIPATSVPSERLFSDAGLLITDRRNRFSTKTIRACICLDSWWSSEIFRFQL
jgi:hAT family C-terminal dimerisation region